MLSGGVFAVCECVCSACETAGESGGAATRRKSVPRTEPKRDSPGTAVPLAAECAGLRKFRSDIPETLKSTNPEQNGTSLVDSHTPPKKT